MQEEHLKIAYKAAVLASSLRQLADWVSRKPIKSRDTHRLLKHPILLYPYFEFMERELTSLTLDL